jgi:transposase
VQTLIEYDLDMVNVRITVQMPSTTSNYGDINQKWVVYHLKPMPARMEKTFEKRLEKEDRKRRRPSQN